VEELGRDWLAWGEKLARYAELGVEELLCFDGDRPDGQRMRAWDRVDGDFVEREVQGDETPCVTLGLAWVVRPVDIVPVGLRLVDGAGVLVPSEVEALAEKGRLAEVARASAEARVRELEEELRRRR
jgi:hypothetical protein